MSFILQYNRLFKVSVLEVSLPEEEIELELTGFSFAPTAQTRKLLNNHQLIFRLRETGFEVYYSINPLAAEPLLGRISKQIQLSFNFFQTDSNFFKIYEPDLTINSVPQLYLDNLTSNGDIQPNTEKNLTVGNVVQSDDAMKIYPPIFSIQTNLSEGETPPTTYRILNKFDPTQTILEVPVNGGDANQVATKIDLSNFPLGPYILESDVPAFLSRTIYITNESPRSSGLGLIDIYWEQPQDIAPPDGLEYKIRFAQR